MDKYAVPNKLPAKQVNVLARRKGRVAQRQADLQKKPAKKKFNIKSDEHFKKPEFFIAEYRKAERDDKRIKRELMRNGLKRSFMKEGSLVLILRHRGYDGYKVKFLC